MKNISKILITSFLLGAFLSFTCFQHASENPASATTNSRNITNIGILIKFSNSDEIVPKRADNTPIHIDDAQSIENAEKLLNSDTLVETELFTNGSSIGKKSVPSVKKYFETQSYDKLSLTTKLLTYQDSHPMEYYLPKTDQNPSGYDSSTKALREAELVNNTINTISSQITSQGLDLKTLDSDNDGKIDAITLFVEGADTSKIFVPQNSLLWSHATINSGKITAKILDREIYAHSIIYGPAYTEQTGTFSLANSGYGTIIHEFGHILGFTDLYRSDGVGKPVGYYDIMGIATSSNPQNFLAYFTSEYRTQTNWHNPLPIINKTTKNITVSKANFTDPSEQRAVKIQPSSTSREYFIVEYYEPHDTREGYSGKSKGIIVYRVNEENKGAGNYNNDTSGKSDHIFIFRPEENTLGAASGDLDHAALNLSRTTLGKTLSADQSFNNETIHYSDGKNSGIIITVTAETTDSVTFNITFPEISGDGTANNPFLISTPETFIYLMQNDTAGKYYKLTENLDFKNLTYPRLNFYGHLDGNSKSLNHISATGTGVFDNIGNYNHSSSIKNLQIVSLIVSPGSGNSSLGGLASSIDNATISNVELISGSVTNAVSSNILAATGGLAGNTTDSTIIENCFSALTVNSPQNAGGLIGLSQNTQVSNSHVSGKVTGDTNTGAFIGVYYTPDGNYSLPTGSTYDKTVNPDLPTVGTLYIANSAQNQSPPADLLQSITVKNDTTEPEVLPTESDILKQLSLTKNEHYLIGFTVGSDVSELRQTISSLNKVQLSYFHDANTNDITSGIISTGMQFAIKIGESPYDYTVIIKGDVNGDGKIYATDYVQVRNHIMSKTKLSATQLKAADINGDGEIYATDYVKIRNHIMGKTPIEQK